MHTLEGKPLSRESPKRFAPNGMQHNPGRLTHNHRHTSHRYTHEEGMPLHWHQLSKIVLEESLLLRAIQYSGLHPGTVFGN